MGRVPFALGAWLEDLTPKIHNLIPDSSSSSSGFLPSSVTACKQSIGVLETHARRLSLHLAKALSFPSGSKVGCAPPPPVQQ